MGPIPNSNKIANQNQTHQLNSFNQINSQLGIHRLALSTGKKINSAEDNPAGFFIGRTFQAQSRGLAVAMNNVGDARSSLSVAEGGANSILDILATMKTKSLQAANGTLSDADRAAINDEINALASEIDDIVASTTFGDQALLGGTELSIQTGAETTSTESVEVSASSHDAASLGVDSVDVSNQAGATDSLSSIDDAMATVKSTVSSLGSHQVRLSSRENHLAQAITGAEEARSRIMDADFAKERLEVMKLQMMQQATMASAAQSGVATQSVIALM